MNYLILSKSRWFLSKTKEGLKLEETDPLEEAEKGEAKGNVKEMKKAFKELDA